MIKKRHIALLLVVVIAASFAVVGCGPKKQPAGEGETEVTEGEMAEKQEFVFNLGSEPPTLDPALCTDSSSSTVINQIFEGLTQRKLGEGGVEPAIAERWDVSEDGKEYVFYLRDGVKWTNGDPVTAEDFEYAWKRVLDPRTASDYAYLLWFIEGAEAANTLELPDEEEEPDKYAEAVKELEGLLDQVGVKAEDAKTLRVNLIAPAPFFLDLMAFFTFMPVNKNAVESNEAWAAEPSAIVSNGPFKLVEWNHKSNLVLVKNDAYWDKDKVKLEKINIVQISDPATSLTAYENNEFDMADSGLVPLPDTPRLLESGEAQRTAFLATYYLDFNCSRKPLDDPRVRKALSLAIDRQSIVDNVTKGGQIPAMAFCPPGIYNPATEKDFREEAGNYFKDADIETAKQLLADAGYPDGKGFPKLTLLYNTEGAHKDIMQAIQQMWKKNLGIEVNLGGEEWQVFLKTRVQGNYDIARDGWIGDYIDPMTFLDMFLSNSPQNNPKWKNTEFDDLIREAKSTNDQAARMQALHDAEEIFIGEMPISPIYFYVQIWQQRDYVKDVMHDIQQNWGFKYAWIEKH
jgi:oligopeptide transport system substrate-binding protein